MAALLAPFLAGAALSSAQIEQLSAYLDLLLRWNARMNLTAVRSPEQIVTRHFGESLFTARTLFPRCPGTGDWLLDVGSGAGFPGLPVKLWWPALRVTLIESRQRKATFLREVVRALRLPGVEVFAGRAEDYAPPPERAPIANCQSHITQAFVSLRAVERFEHALPVAAGVLQRVPAQRRGLALLLGAAQVAAARALLPGFTFAEPVTIPQSAARVLLLALPAESG